MRWNSRNLGPTHSPNCVKKTFEYSSRKSHPKIVLSEDGKYGQIEPETGEWSGMVGMVVKGKGDLIAADLTTTFARQEVLDFSRSFMSSPLTVLTKVGGKSLK